VSFFICVERFVDPDLGWDSCWFGGLADEAFGVDAIGGIENGSFKAKGRPPRKAKLATRRCRAAVVSSHRELSSIKKKSANGFATRWMPRPS
jgi:hypothetical protein